MKTPTPDLDAILTEERIERMRHHILDGTSEPRHVRPSRTRSATRTRWNVLGAVAAGVAIIVAAGVGGAVLNDLRESHGGSDTIASSDDAAVPAAPAVSAQPESAPAADSKAAGAAAPAPQSLPSDGAGDTSPSDRQVITTGSASITTADPTGSARQLATWAESVGGRVDDRSETNDDGVSASVTIRVPSNKVTAATDELGRYGTVDRIDISHRDVTSTVQDLDARIHALQVSVNRLTEIMARADTSSALVQVESELTQRQSQLEQLQTQRRATADQIDLSTLTVTFRVKPEVSRSGFTGGVHAGWDALVRSGQGLITVVGWLLPWLLVVGVLWFAWRYYRKFTRRTG